MATSPWRGLATTKGRSLGGLVLLVLLLGGGIYGPTLSLSYAYDDVDYLNAAADHLSGRTSLSSVLLRPQGEHFLPALRLAFAASARLFGADALPWRLLVLSSHLASALLLAGVARRYLPSAPAAAATAVAYVLPAGFSSMWVWFPSGGCVPIGLVGITGAMLAIANRERLGTRRARLLAAAGVVWAIVFENGLVPLAASPALLDEWERRRAGSARRPIGIFTCFCLLLMAGAALATSVLYRRLTGATIDVHLLPAVLRTGFLLISAPFRLLFPGQHLPQVLGAGGGASLALGAYGLVALVLGTALVAPVLVPRARALVTGALLSSFGALGFIGLVAVARSTTAYSDLFDSDRYFFPLLIPGALLAGAVFGSVAERSAVWSRGQRSFLWAMVGLLLVVELPLHAFALRRRVPFDVYAAHARRFEQLSQLGDLLAARANALPLGHPPLAFPDASFYFPDVHNGRLSGRFLLYVAARSRSARLVLGGPGGDVRNERILNEVLDDWCVKNGEPEGTFQIVDGEVRDARQAGAVRFLIGPFNGAMVEGFYPWEGTHRWAGPRAVLRLRATGARLRLRLATAVTALRSGLPGFESQRVIVSVDEGQTGVRHRVGEVVLSEDGIADYPLELPRDLADGIRGRSVRVILEGAPAWRPRDVIPGSTDDRLLTFQVYEAAFEDPAVPGGHSK